MHRLILATPAILIHTIEEIGVPRCPQLTHIARKLALPLTTSRAASNKDASLAQGLLHFTLTSHRQLVPERAAATPALRCCPYRLKGDHSLKPLRLKARRLLRAVFILATAIAQASSSAVCEAVPRIRRWRMQRVLTIR